MIEVHRKHGFRENFLGRSNDNFQHPLVGVFSCALRELNNERSLGLDAALEQAQGLLQVVDVVGTNRVLPVRKLKEV